MSTVSHLPNPTVAVDSLDDLAGTIVGDGLLLQPAGDGSYRLYDVAVGQARLIGTYTDAAHAWKALDAIDAPLAA